MAGWLVVSESIEVPRYCQGVSIQLLVVRQGCFFDVSIMTYVLVSVYGETTGEMTDVPVHEQ